MNSCELPVPYENIPSQSFSVIQWHPCLCSLERPTAQNLDFILPTNVLILLLNMYIALNKIWCCFAHFKILHTWFHIICNLLQFALFAQYYVGAIFPCGYSSGLRVCALQLNVWLFAIYFFILLLIYQLRLFSLLSSYYQYFCEHSCTHMRISLGCIPGSGNAHWKVKPIFSSIGEGQRLNCLCVFTFPPPFSPPTLGIPRPSYLYQSDGYEVV